MLIKQENIKTRRNILLKNDLKTYNALFFATPGDITIGYFMPAVHFGYRNWKEMCFIERATINYVFLTISKL